MPQHPFYGSAKWRETREKYLRSHPYCDTCAKLGLRGKAIDVDHIIGLRDGGAPFDSKNLRGYCKTHHSQKTVYTEGWHKDFGKVMVITGEDGFPIQVEKPRSITRGPPKKFTGK